MPSKITKGILMLGLNVTGELKISISFPALADLVAYLQARDSELVDALSSKLTAAQQGLKQSSTDLEAVETKEKK